MSGLNLCKFHKDKFFSQNVEKGIDTVEKVWYNMGTEREQMFP